MQDSSTVHRFGIDTLAVVAPVRVLPDRLIGQRTKRHLDLKTGEIAEQVTSELAGADGVVLNVDLWRSSKPQVRMELSVPRSLRGDNRVPADAGEVLRAVESAREQTSEVVDWLADTDDFVISRVDLARDFIGIRHPSAMLRNLMTVPAHRMTSIAHMTPDGTGVQTLTRQTERHTSRLYDRSAMYTAMRRSGAGDSRALADADAGVVRYELQLRRKQAAHEGLSTLGDLHNAPLFQIAHRFFSERCRFDSVVASPTWKLSRAWQQHCGQTDAKSPLTTAVLGQLVLDAFHLKGEANPRTQAKYRRAFETAGLMPQDLLAADVTPVQLDFAGGRLRRLEELDLAA
ncbi:hypothetical protein NOCA170040 [metagenome]|uniref:Replication-associated protein G2P N-terminal domain-containing protein n=1 Tax=metagenome TaxID=256318 RepID=A0A2P2CJC0_9ZZZZ